MPDVFMYADETGNLDYQEHQGASTYFGVGTAAFSGNHGEALGGGLALRADLAAAGVKLRGGFHAVDDSKIVRSQSWSDPARSPSAVGIAHGRPGSRCLRGVAGTLPGQYTPSTCMHRSAVGGRPAAGSVRGSARPGTGRRSGDGALWRTAARVRGDPIPDEPHRAGRHRIGRVTRQQPPSSG